MDYIINTWDGRKMTGRERIIQLYNGMETDRIPWVPYVGIHSGHLIGTDAKTLLWSSEKLAQGFIKAKDLYKPDGLPIVFDLQVEAEILGAKLQWQKHCVPSVISHPFEKDFAIPEFDKTLFSGKNGRLKVIQDAIRLIKKEDKYETALYGLICGPFTLAALLRGDSFMMDVVIKEKEVKKLLEYTAKAAHEMVNFYKEAGVDVIGIVDPMVSQISPDLFKKLCHHMFKDLFAYINGLDMISNCFVCGNATKQIENLCLTGPHGIAVDEHVNIVDAAKITQDHNLVLSGNIPVSTLLLHGSFLENQEYALKLLDNSPKGFILATGCDIPYDTPSNNLIAIERCR